MSQEEKKRKTKAMSGAILFHCLLLLFFLFNGLTEPDPPLPQESASIELGWTDSGSGDVESQVVAENDVIEEVAPEPTETVQETVEEFFEEVATEENSEIAAPVSEETQPVEEQQEPVEETPQPTQQLQDAMTNVFSTPTGGGSDGPDDDGPGNTGSPDGSVSGSGVMGGTGNGWELLGRGYLGGATVAEKPREEGKVVLNIVVGRDGKVIRTSPNLRESDTASQYLFNLAKKAAMNAKFNADPSMAVEQKGKLTFYFVLE